MKKVTQMPIGLGMNHLEQEIAACQLWNRHAEAGSQPNEWIELSAWNPNSNLFASNTETGLSLEGSGFLEIDRANSRFRLTPKAIQLIDKFVYTQ